MGIIISETKDNTTIMRGASVNAASQNGTLLDLMEPKFTYIDLTYSEMMNYYKFQ